MTSLLCIQWYEHEIKTQKQSFKKDNPTITGIMKIIQTQRQLTNDTMTLWWR